MSSYTWEPIPDGETPAPGEMVRLSGWGGSDSFLAGVPFVGFHTDGRHFTVQTGPGGEAKSFQLSPISGPLLRRVDPPSPRWEAWCNVYGENVGATFTTRQGCEESAQRNRSDQIHIWCDADGELHIERVDSP